MYTLNYSDPQLFNLQRFAEQLQAGRSSLEVFREALKHGNELISQRFKAQMWATDAVHQRAWLVDQILRHAWQRYDWSEPERIALIAVGGYGRRELHPASDIDVMILLESAIDVKNQQCIEGFIRFLWDIQLEVGHSVRTLDECEREAAGDVTVITNLVESRLLLGQKSLFKSMQERISPDRLWSSKEFFSAKFQEQMQRYHKYHDTAYNLEPNIKEGPGGLRDIQTIGWIAKRYFGINTLYDLVQQHGFLTEEEYKILISGQEFIWQIRFALHEISKRREDRLIFDHQRTLATLFNFYDEPDSLGVERFMKRYYRTIKELGSLNDMLLQLFQEVILYGDAPAKITPINKRFQIHNGYIETTYEKVFLHYPFALLEIFLLMQQNPEIQGVRASTIRQIRHYRRLIDDAFHKDLRARSLFYEIIRQPHGVTRALRRMNQYGVLPAYIPAFGRIVGQMQYDLFHVYTVDQHTLFVVRNLRRFCKPEFRQELPLCSEIMAYLPKPELLYLAAMFHDIAKGRGGDHSALGEVESLQFCQAHGLSDYDSRLVAWLVRYHLLMSTTAQRKDLSDPEVINSFVCLVEDSMHLDYLYLLTVADIRGTNPKLWNSWKDALLADLYHKTQRVLRYGTRQVLDKHVRIHDIQLETLSLLGHLDRRRIDALWESLGEEYFLYSSPQDIARETQAILNHNSPDKPLVLERQGNRAGTEFIVIYTQERDQLFARITRYLEQAQLNVVDAYILSTSGCYTISGYTVLEEDGSEIDSQARIDETLEGLVRASSQNTPFTPINRRLSRQLRHFTVPTRITFSQDTVNDHTTVEVITTDRPGVLSRIAQAFLICDVQVKRAKIATFGSRVEDIFFITNNDGHALYSAEKLDCLRDQLSQLLDEGIPVVGTLANVN